MVVHAGQPGVRHRDSSRSASARQSAAVANQVGPRTVTITGIVLGGIGNLLAAVGPHEIWWWDVTYGVIGGLGNGMATSRRLRPSPSGSPISAASRPMVVMGFGFGAFIYGFVLKAIPDSSRHPKTPARYADAKSVRSLRVRRSMQSRTQ